MPTKKEYIVTNEEGFNGSPKGTVLDMTDDEAAAAPTGHIEPFVGAGATQGTPPPPPPGPEKTFTLTASQLKELVQEATKPLADKVSILEAVADTKQLENWYRKNRKDQGMTVRLSTHGGKVITKWSVFEDTVAQDINSGRWFEKQIMRVDYEDGTTIDVPYVTFTNMIRLTQVQAKVIEKTEVVTDDPDVKKYRFKVKREDNGKEYEILDSFVN